jgi:hypothetical protein
MKKCLTLLALYGLTTLITLEAGEKRLPLKGEAFTIEGHTAFLILPEKPKAGQPIPWVWYAPTLRGLQGRAVYSALHKHLVAPPPTPPDRRPGTPGLEKQFLSSSNQYPECHQG